MNATRLWHLWERVGIFVILAVLVGAFAAGNEDFRRPANLPNVLLQCTPIGIAAIGMTFAIISVLIYASFTNFLRAWSIGDSTMDIRLPTWPAKLMVPLALSVLWLRLSLQICGYLRMIAHPDAQPVAVPKLITLETQVQDEIAEALGREELNREQGR